MRLITTQPKNKNRIVTANGDLETVHLRNCQVIKDGDIKSLIYHCREMAELDLSDCHALTDHALQQLGGKYMTKLRKLSLDGCQGITSR